MPALDSIMDGQLLRGIFEVFTDSTGDAFFFFVILSMFSVLVYVQTGSASFTALIFVVMSGALVGSHLTQFSENFGLIPQQFQFIVLGFVLLAFLYVLWQALTQKT